MLTRRVNKADVCGNKPRRTKVVQRFFALHGIDFLSGVDGRFFLFSAKGSLTRCFRRQADFYKNIVHYLKNSHFVKYYYKHSISKYVNIIIKLNLANKNPEKRLCLKKLINRINLNMICTVGG